MRALRVDDDFDYLRPVAFERPAVRVLEPVSVGYPFVVEPVQLAGWFEIEAVGCLELGSKRRVERLDREHVKDAATVVLEQDNCRVDVASLDCE